ncbi:dynein heavy chain 12, axonemal-like isoform X1 [Scyliorhinus canicula]|uniref:dynein heavy chain 12, axonemal-like isoform X1 n=1 Tax=Scyliorhinus canicula TaxID=7830 RepID=UPI0018F72974|nr:dynein heavy chain 12, axonemal-like isoform X1 [Scyliorhinus canicula]XP_038668756.1 dynein heavy chain 12, axonemal-like isoform X1 [Scyliorhinus canicula]
MNVTAAEEEWADEEIMQHVLEQSLLEISLQDLCLPSVEADNFRFFPSKENRKIVEAIKTGQEADVRQLSIHCFAFDEADDRGWLPLHEAAVQLDLAILEATFEASHPSMWERKTLKGETPLFLAVQLNLIDNVQYLLVKDSNPNTKDEEGNSALIIAIRNGTLDVTSLLLRFGAAVNLECNNKRTALHEAAKLGRKDLVDLLIHAGAIIDPRSAFGLTPLALAAQNGHTEVVKCLLQKGANVLSQASDGLSVLFEAAKVANSECLALLLEHGADANVPKISGHLPIHRASYRGHYQSVKQLIPVTDYSAIKESGISPVHSAAAGGQYECLKLLLQFHFDVNFMLSPRLRRGYDDHRKSALYFAVSNNDVFSARLLLKAGAFPNQDPINCLQLALRLGNYELINLLLRHGANVNYYCRVNTTHFPSALQYALNDEVMLRMLFSYEYDIHRCFDCPHENKIHPLYSSEGWTPSVIKDNMFCDVITLNWLKHLSGKVVRVMLDYVAYVRFCSKLKATLKQQSEWPEITHILKNPRCLKHLCRLKIRKCMGRMRLRCPVFMTFLSLPMRLKEYIRFKEYNLYDGQET